MVRWLGWHCPPDTGFEIRALAVWGRARYLSVTETPHNTDFHTWMGKKLFFCFFQTAETGNRTPNSGVKGSDANHYPRTPALYSKQALSGLWINVGQSSETVIYHLNNTGTDSITWLFLVSETKWCKIQMSFYQQEIYQYIHVAPG